MAPSRSDHFDEFKAHTRLKHAILQAYLQVWARKLLLRPGADTRVWYVDGFAGEGMDGAGNHGSPILASRIAAQTEGQLRAMGCGNVSVATVFFEAKKSRFKNLCANLQPFGERARVIHGTLEDHIDDIRAQARDEACLYFIDPFGLRVDASVVRRALEGPRNEVLALFADQAALRHFGVVSAPDLDIERALSQRQQTLFDDAAVEQQLRARAERGAQALAVTREASRAILDAAFGGPHWEAAIDGVDREYRRQHFLFLYEQMLGEFGARHVLPLPVRSEANKHVYHLMHATKSPAGYTTMKRAIESALKEPHIGGGVADAMRFLISMPVGRLEQMVRTHFAGQTVDWADSGDRTRPSVTRFVLEETSAFPTTLAELKRELASLKVRAPGAHQYQFPARPAS
jgi:three-Cys-motif partner protein